MAIRKLIRIDEEKCDGCGLCVPACAEGAIQIIDGKARLVSETYCDGLGACLGECPQDAITIAEREAAEFDEAAVERHLKNLQGPARETLPQVGSGCPGAAMRSLSAYSSERSATNQQQQSQLRHWPVQLMLVPPHAPFLKNADLLICADCVPFAIPDFHDRYLSGRAVLVGCPKLDDLDYYLERLKAIFQEAQPVRITVLRMEVPCCGGIAEAVLRARLTACPGVEAEIHTIGIRGEIHIEDAPTGVDHGRVTAGDGN